MQGNNSKRLLRGDNPAQMQSQARKKVLTIKIYKAMKEKLLNIGTYNNWRGCIGLYLTKKEIRSLKRLGITEGTTIKEAYNLL